MAAMISADLYILEKHGPLTYIGFTPAAFEGRASLLAGGALLILERSSFSLCISPENERVVQDLPTET